MSANSKSSFSCSLIEENFPIEGGCACGNVRYKINGPWDLGFKCHCRDCQRSSGSAYAAILVIDEDKIHICGGLQFYTSIGDSGRDVNRGFCAICGNYVIVKIFILDSKLGIYAPTLDDPSLYWPEISVYTSSKQEWDSLPEGIKIYPKLRSDHTG